MFKENQNETIKITNAPIVSSDIIGNEAGAIVDAALTNIIEKDGKVLAKIVAWYDNEVGYTAQMIRTISKICWTKSNYWINNSFFFKNLFYSLFTKQQKTYYKYKESLNLIKTTN